MDTLLTAHIAANSPRYRRKSSTFIDGIHDVSSGHDVAPAQLYSTMSGRLFHSGRIAIVMVGLPARGKTHISVSIARYLSWLGVKTRIFHLGDYRRATVGPNGSVPEDYFFPKALPSTMILRQKIVKKCREDIFAWLDHENGQVAIYDAVNGTASGRKTLAKEFARHDVQTIFIESFVDDERILRENARNVKISSPDFHGMDPDEAAKLYLKRIEMKIPSFETMFEPELNFIKMINAGKKILYNGISSNYLSHRIGFFVTNVHIKSRTTYFARPGRTTEQGTKADAPLSKGGQIYAQKLVDHLLGHHEQERIALSKRSGAEVPPRPLIVWTSTRQHTIQTARPLEAMGIKIRHRSELGQLIPGACEKLSPQAIRRLYPDEVEKHEKDPYHHRYPRAESYHDLAVRLEPIILELEQEQNDLLIIAHESVLRVLYGYLMHCSIMEIPHLKFPRDAIMKVIPAAYQNEAHRIFVPGLEDEALDQSLDQGPGTSTEDQEPELNATTTATTATTTTATVFPEADSGVSPVASEQTQLEPGRALLAKVASSTSVSSSAADRRPERVISKDAAMVAGTVDDED